MFAGGWPTLCGFSKGGSALLPGCHPERSDPIFSSAPNSGASGRVVEGSRHPLQLDASPLSFLCSGRSLDRFLGLSWLFSPLSSRAPKDPSSPLSSGHGIVANVSITVLGLRVFGTGRIFSQRVGVGPAPLRAVFPQRKVVETARFSGENAASGCT